MRGEVTSDQARSICASVRHYFVVLHRTDTLVASAINIALRLQHPIYDCFERAGCRLITADRRLLAATATSDFASLVVHVAGL